MLLNYIKLNNFRQYKGENTITFSSDPEKNVTVVLGMNTSGKTTLVQAFNWVLYGKINFLTQEILNDDIRITMDRDDSAEVKVTLQLTHNNTEYTIERSQLYNCVSKNDVRHGSVTKNMYFKKPDGQTKSVEGYEIEKTINKILPEGLSNYFFFDGERITKISDKSDVAASVKGLMGLDVLEMTRDHLTKAIKDFEKSLDLEGNERAEEIQSLIESKTELMTKCKKDIEEIEEQILFYNKKRDELKITINENAETEELQLKREEAKNGLTILTNDYNRSLSNLIENFNYNIYTFFGQPLFSAAEEVLDSTSFKVEGLGGISAHAIDEIIKRGYCVCGTKISCGIEAYEHLLKERRLLPPESIGTLVKNYKEDLCRFKESGSKYYKDIENTYQSLRTFKRSIREKSEEIEILDQKLLNRKDMSLVTGQLFHTEKTLQEKQNDKGKILYTMAQLDKIIEQAKRQRDALTQSNEKNAFINVCRTYGEALHDWVNKAYTEKEIEIRSDLEESVNNIFSKIYHGKRTISIDKNYKISYSDIKTDESSGLETVKNFAFIAGLVDLGQKKLNQKSEDDIDLGTEPYPLVMDAPFSTADEKHVSNISRILPDIAEQVIMVLMEKDWVYAQKELSNRVGKVYRIEKNSETQSKITEEE